MGQPSQQISRTTLSFDIEGYVTPPETFVGLNAQNWFAIIMGRDKKYKWARKFIPKHLPLPNSLPKYHRASFSLGKIYEFGASFQEKSDAQIAEKKRGIPEDKHWLIDREAKRKSKYNGFWRVSGVNDTGITMERVMESDLKQVFPDDRKSDDMQSSLFEYMDDDEE